MSRFRKEKPIEICGKKVKDCIDYLDNAKTGLPKSDVLLYDLGNNENIVIRPSGTEPNLKIYLALYTGLEETEEYFRLIFDKNF